MQAKLDELLRAIENARQDFIGIEHLTDSQIEQIRLRLEEDEGCGPDRSPSKDAIARLLVAPIEGAGQMMSAGTKSVEAVRNQQVPAG